MAWKSYLPVSKTDSSLDKDWKDEAEVERPAGKKGGSSEEDAEGEERSGSSRLAKLRVIAILFILLLIANLYLPLVGIGHKITSYIRPEVLTVEARVRKVLTENPLIDGHIDLPMVIRLVYGNHIELSNFTEPFTKGDLYGHVDLPRLRDGLSGGAFWSVYAPCPKDLDDFSDKNYAESVQYTLDQIDVVTRLRTKFSDDFSRNVDSDTALEAFKQGKFISPMGVEGLHQIGNKVSNLRRFYDLGARYATLTHNCHNKFADAALVGASKSKALWGGLSPAGRELVHEMNRMGMLVDISHVSEDTMIDVLGGRKDWEGSKAPVMFSHSSAYSICPHPRNVKDKILQLVKNSNSVIMVNIVPDFISCIDEGNQNGIPTPDLQHATLDKVVEHILHISDKIGFDHIGIGTDFDGTETLPKGLEDVSKYKDLFAALLDRGVSDEDAAKIAGGNILRVWRDAELIAAKLQDAGYPVMEDDIGGTEVDTPPQPTSGLSV